MFKPERLLAASALVFSLYPLAAIAQTGTLRVPAAASLPAFGRTGVSSSALLLPDAPAPQPSAAAASLGEKALNAIEPGYAQPTGKWDIVVANGVKAQPFSAADKIYFAWTEEANPISLFTAVRSAGYEHLRDSDPHFGSDKAGFGERLGAAAFRQGVTRIMGDGVLAAWTHEDPRYYRIGVGRKLGRGLRSMEQVLVRRRDDGSSGISYSGIAGHALGETLPVAFYPDVSAKASVAARSFGTSLAADAGLKLIREFLPDLFVAAHLVSQPAAH